MVIIVTKVKRGIEHFSVHFLTDPLYFLGKLGWCFHVFLHP